MNFHKPKDWEQHTGLDRKAQEYVNSRGLSNHTILDWNLKTKDLNGKKAIAFPLKRNGEVVNVKYRTGDKRFQMVSGAEVIPFGLDNIKDAPDMTELTSNEAAPGKVMFLTEGEFDAMTVWQAGYRNVMSMPSASNLDWLDNCSEDIAEVVHWVLLTDNDPAGREARHQLVSRLADCVCYTVDLGGCKDVNQLLQEQGEDAVKAALGKITLMEPDVVDMEDEASRILRYYHEGAGTAVPLGIPSLDKHYKVLPGNLIILMGIPTHGKTAFARMMMVSLAKKYGWRWGMHSTEEKPRQELWMQLIRAYLGRPIWRAGNQRERLTEDDIREATPWLSQYFHLFSPHDRLATPQEVVKAARQMVRSRGIKAFMLDPWSGLDLSRDRRKGEREDEYLNRSLSEMRLLAEKHNMAFVIVAHPKTMRETDQQGNLIPPSPYDLSGGSQWYNRADDILCIHRPSTPDFASQVITYKIKKQDVSGRPSRYPIDLFYNTATGRYFDAAAGDIFGDLSVTVSNKNLIGQ